MPKKQPPAEDQNRDDLVKVFSQAATRAHDKGNESAAHGLTVAALKLMTGKKD
jgi:hypothetical protein